MSENAQSDKDELLLWGGLYLALANGDLHPAERERLVTVMGGGRVEAALAQGEPSAEACLERFCRRSEGLGKRLRALELYQLLDGLLQVVASDGEIEQAELNAFEVLATRLGLGEGASEAVIGNFLSEMRDSVTIKLDP